MYKFPLEAVLTHRKFIEDNLQKKFGILKRILADEIQKHADIKNEKKSLSKKLQELQNVVITVSENLLYVRFIQQLSNRLDEQSKRIIDAEKQVDLKRDALISAVKDRKALEKLKEKGLKSYLLDQAKKEQAFSDEMASVRYKRKK